MSKPWLLKVLLNKVKKPASILDKILIVLMGGGLLLLVGLFASMAWFMFSNRSVTYLLPAEKTIAVFELEDLSLPPRLKQETVLDLLGLSAMAKATFGLDASTLQSKLSDGRLGLALIDDGTPQNKPLLFMHVVQRGNALKYLESLALPDETLTLSGDKKNLIYSYPKGQAFVFGFVGPYLFVAKDAETIKMIQDVEQQKLPSLEADATVQKSLSNLPKKTWARGYLNLQALSFGADSRLGQTVTPLATLLDHLTFTVRKEHNGFHFNTLLSMAPDALALKKGAVAKNRFTYGLADTIGSKALAGYIGGSDLSAEWQNTLESLSQLNPTYGIILEGILRAQANKIFGEDVSLSDDLYPLFEGEYALAFENLEKGQLGVKLMLKHSDRAFADIKLKKLQAGFRLLAAQFSPRVKSVTLPDGTISKEMVADATRLKETSETYQDADIQCLEIADSPMGFCTALTDDLILLGNNLASIKETIDLTITPKFALSQSQSFRQSLSNLSAVSDEISYFDLGNVMPLLKAWPTAAVASNLLDPFTALTWVKHTFTDGVATEGYLLLK
jgi:hypothetical protein